MYSVKIAKSSQILNRIIDLRYEVLRKPWNQSKETATDNHEESSINAFIESEDRLIACGRLQDNGNGVGQIRYMAVHPDFQGKGLGKLLVEKLEEEAKQIKLSKLELQARENAVEFYQNCGYTVKEKTFKLWDIIQHYLMVKNI